MRDPTALLNAPKTRYMATMMGEYLFPSLAREVFSYLLAPEEAFVYARLLPENTFLQKLSTGVTLQRAAEFAAGIDWVEGLSELSNEGKNMDLNAVLNNASRNGHIAAMELVKSWGANEFDKALDYAANGGHIAAMELVRSWGATDFNGALQGAAYGGHIAAMELLKTWGATYFWGAISFNQALWNAASEGHIAAFLGF